MEDRELQTVLMETQAQWNYWVAKPFRQMFDEGVSVGMYYCLQRLRQHGDSMTMSELARSVHCSRQQMTKTVNQLIGCDFAERISDPDDRRIIRLRLTKAGIAYTEHLCENAEVFYRSMFASMTAEEKKDFGNALCTLHRIFTCLSERCDVCARSDEPDET